MNRFNPERETGGDLFDQASQLADMLLEANLAQRRGLSAPETHPDFDGEKCVECLLPIPAERLALGKVRCVPCQEDREREQKSYERA